MIYYIKPLYYNKVLKSPQDDIIYVNVCVNFLINTRNKKKNTR